MQELGRAVKACSAGPCKDLKKIYLWGAPITCTSESFCSVDAGFAVHHCAASALCVAHSCAESCVAVAAGNKVTDETQKWLEESPFTKDIIDFSPP